MQGKLCVDAAFIYFHTDLVVVNVIFSNTVKGFTLKEVENALNAALTQVQDARLLQEQSGPKNALHYRALQIRTK